jgi:hypothetical protein
VYKCTSPHANPCAGRDPTHGGSFPWISTFEEPRTKTTATGNHLSSLGSGPTDAGVKGSMVPQDVPSAAANFVDMATSGTAL